MSASSNPEQPRTGAVLIIPAHNESEHIGHIVQNALQLVSSGVLDDFVVVDDHSTDATAETALGLGAKVIPQYVSPNPGKGEAFLSGLLWAKNKGARYVVTIDADLDVDSFLSAAHIHAVLAPLNGPDAVDMSILPCKERRSSENFGWMQNPISGQRAIRIDALNFLFSPPVRSGEFSLSNSSPALRFRQFISGYALEVGLNRRLPSAVYISDKSLDLLIFKLPYRHDMGLAKDNSQDHQVRRAQLISGERNGLFIDALRTWANQRKMNGKQSPPISSFFPGQKLILP